MCENCVPRRNVTAEMRQLAVDMVKAGGRDAALSLILESIQTLRSAGYDFGISVHANTGTMFVFLGTKDDPDRDAVILEGNTGDFEDIVRTYLAGQN